MALLGSYTFVAEQCVTCRTKTSWEKGIKPFFWNVNNGLFFSWNVNTTWNEMDKYQFVIKFCKALKQF